jgi:hypothetical protein
LPLSKADWPVFLFIVRLADSIQNVYLDTVMDQESFGTPMAALIWLRFIS